MSGITTAQSLRFGTLDDPISSTMTEVLAEDIERELGAADALRTAAMKRPVVMIRNNASQTFAAGGGGTIVTFNVEDIDTHGMVNLGTSNSRATVSSQSGPGIYYVQFTCSSPPSSWTTVELTIRKNAGNQVRKKIYSNTTTAEPNIATFLWLGAVADYTDVVLYHDGGGTDAVFDAVLKLHKITTN